MSNSLTKAEEESLNSRDCDYNFVKGSEKSFVSKIWGNIIGKNVLGIASKIEFKLCYILYKFLCTQKRIEYLVLTNYLGREALYTGFQARTFPKRGWWNFKGCPAIWILVIWGWTTQVRLHLTFANILMRLSACVPISLTIDVPTSSC